MIAMWSRGSLALRRELWRAGVDWVSGGSSMDSAARETEVVLWN